MPLEFPFDPNLGSFLEILGFAFMQRALITGIATALVCGVISCFVIHVGWSLMGDAISHAILPGVVISYILQLPYAVGAVVAALIAVALIGLVRQSNVISSDTSMGIVFTTLFSFGTVLISKVPSQTSLSHILFGNLLGVTPSDMWQVLVLGSIVLVAVVALRRDLALFTFDPMHAQALGKSPRVLSCILLVALAITVVVSLQAVGIILSVAMLVTPGATARMLTDNFWKMLWLSPAIAALATVLGICASYVLDASSGGMIGVVLGILFALAAIFGSRGVRVHITAVGN
ncbi:MAG: metal ABC transporter permease [Atopobium sp.]|uniref:metal ABC transporter permease n=1 Tax=Atopobium sp. TaxID=1872650 RepID=UPI002A7547B7|nr:metal ABC transporter permease [Atopobium sp.]MDY2788667.1 metal ABC transporter permease [Atopobium sp.]MDY4522015.1 metal ABC transporter permease [Atopobium sp.]